MTAAEERHSVEHILPPGLNSPLYTHTQSVLTAIFPGEPGLAAWPLNSPSPFIPGLRILLAQT